ncbi:DUF5924 family protein [Litchfieldella xinjiangensis]|uniref:DUF5924 family protein n=1 Tax=Litchfieldella xinjiangensis TaxID=1166948 RepID=UPI0005B7C969|nr:DUF5924 family protein [Halomonas xinjiangensis]
MSSHRAANAWFARFQAITGTAERLVKRLRPFLWLWPPIAFGAGVASFFLVERQQWLGAALALAMLLAWVLLLTESLLSRVLARFGYPSPPRTVTTFIAQMIHQETLFFSLPFLLATTVWTSGQALFTVLIMAMAVLAILDPLYFRLAERHRWIYFAFHAQCVFVVMLVVLPLMLHLTTGESLRYALLVMVVFSLPSLLHLIRPRRVRSWLALITLLGLLATLGWVGRAWVPPATLWISGSALSPGFDVEERRPRGSLRLQTDEVRRSGLYAYTAIHAPRGLRETVYHEWRYRGGLVDRVPLEIRGGRQQGYRAWSHKRNFPEDPSGDWRIDVMTASGQRIGMIRFEVNEDASESRMATGTISPPAGLPGLDWPRLVPGNGASEEGAS